MNMPPEQNKRKLLAVTLTIPLMVLNITTFFVGLRATGFADFRHLYTAGYMVRTGHQYEIYDANANREFQDRIVSYGNGRTIIFNHLAYEAFVFVPLSLTTYQIAFFVFLIANCVLLILSFRLLRDRFGDLRMPPWFVVTLYLGFLPVIFVLDQGQDSIILFSLMAGAALLIDRGHEFTAGALVGLTLFKFQFAIPMVLLYFVWRRWRLIGGFACSSLAVLALSLWTVGLTGFVSYLHSLVSSSVGPSSGLEGSLGIHPEAMTNLRGLFYDVFNGRVSHFSAQLILGVASTAMLIWAATRRASFSLAITTAILVSYHCFANDAILLLIPLSVMTGRFLRGEAQHWRGAVLAALIAAPTILLHVGERYCLMAILMLALSYSLSDSTSKSADLIATGTTIA